MRAGQVCGTCTGCSPFYSGGFPGVCANVPTRAECLAKNGVWGGYAGSLSNGGERLTLSALLTCDVHSRDVTQRLQSERITDLTDFAWVSQLRHYWRNADGFAEMAQVRPTTAEDTPKPSRLP